MHPLATTYNPFQSNETSANHTPASLMTGSHIAYRVLNFQCKVCKPNLIAETPQANTSSDDSSLYGRSFLNVPQLLCMHTYMHACIHTHAHTNVRYNVLSAIKSPLSSHHETNFLMYGLIQRTYYICTHKLAAAPRRMFVQALIG